MVKKIYTVYTKDHRLLGDLEYNVFAENISEAIKKVEIHGKGKICYGSKVFM